MVWQNQVADLSSSYPPALVTSPYAPIKPGMNTIKRSDVYEMCSPFGNSIMGNRQNAGFRVSHGGPRKLQTINIISFETEPE